MITLPFRAKKGNRSALRGALPSSARSARKQTGETIRNAIGFLPRPAAGLPERRDCQPRGRRRLVLFSAAAVAFTGTERDKTRRRPPALCPVPAFGVPHRPPERTARSGWPDALQVPLRKHRALSVVADQIQQQITQQKPSSCVS